MASTEKAVQQPTADLPSGDPIPSAVAPSSIPQPIVPRSSGPRAILDSAPSHIDAFLAHLNRCLSTPSGVDTTLLFLCYTSRLSGAVLESLTRPAIKRSASQLLTLAASLPPSTTILFASTKTLAPAPAAILLGLAKRLKAFSALLSDARTFLRLWALLGMYFWAKSLIARLRNARKTGEHVDRLETSLQLTQLVSCVVFQSMENVAYLAQKNVLNWHPSSIGKAYRWSSRLWGAFVGLKLGELFYTSYRRSQRTVAEKLGDKTVAQMERDEREWNDEWRRNVVRQMAWFPLTIHWGLEQGLFGDMTVGVLASIPGIVQMRDLWRRTGSAA